MFHSSSSPSSQHQLAHYYNAVYPVQHVWKFVQWFSPDACDWLLKSSSETIQFRGAIKSVDELIRLTRHHLPLDGVHAVMPECVKFDLDYDSSAPNRASICECTAAARTICNKCFQIIACSALIYEWLLQNQYNLTRTLCVYSGGRGVHIFARGTDPTLELPMCKQRRIFAEVSELPHELVHHLLTSDVACIGRCEALIRSGKGAIQIDLSQFTRTTNPLFLLDTPRLEDIAIPSWIISVYGKIIVPHVRQTVWPLWYNTPNIGTLEQLWKFAETGCAESPRTVEHVVQDRCIPCALCILHTKLKLFVVLSSDDDDSLSESQLLVRMFFRLDTFLLLVYIFWLRADANLMGKSHPLRLPFSPHCRTGKISLPVEECLITSLNVSNGVPSLSSLAKSNSDSLSLYTNILSKKLP